MCGEGDLDKPGTSFWSGINKTLNNMGVILKGLRRQLKPLEKMVQFEQLIRIELNAVIYAEDYVKAMGL